VYSRPEQVAEKLDFERLLNFVLRVRIPSLAPISFRSGTKPACYHPSITDYFIMTQPTKPVTLSVEQIGELNQKLSALRHDLNNSLSLIAATVALIRHRPTVTEQMWNTLAEQPRKIGESFSQFARDLEATLHITRS